MPDLAHPPETLEGWYSLHQVFQVDRAVLRALPPDVLSQERLQGGARKGAERGGKGCTPTG